jgi:hypothetical protein
VALYSKYSERLNIIQGVSKGGGICLKMDSLYAFKCNTRLTECIKQALDNKLAVQNMRHNKRMSYCFVANNVL